MGDSNFDTLVASTFTGDVTGDVTGDITGAITFTSVARTATADGTGTGTIADAGLLQFVAVTSAGANNIVILPTPTPGTLVMMRVGANGFELRSSAPSTVSINGGSGASAESAIAANSTVFMLCASATAWDGFEIIAGTTFGAVEAAA